MPRIPRAIGFYFAALEFIFALGWTSYSFYLPQLAAGVGLSAGSVSLILMLDQAIFTVTDFCAGVAADKAPPPHSSAVSRSWRFPSSPGRAAAPRHCSSLSRFGR